MKIKEGFRWAALGAAAVFLFFLGRSNYHQHSPGGFVLIILVTVAVLILVLFTISRGERA